ncbi:unnamed protein product [Owenia fusiformis]|uniref:Ion transport domain-containing protein n=1 Tax=Owenia fusiformis TaxID=6347 RepID=A0A8S4Q6K7_OWEFU|nr:unnamed protein product [Owenia fusiformis]
MEKYHNIPHINTDDGLSYSDPHGALDETDFHEYRNESEPGTPKKRGSFSFKEQELEIKKEDEIELRKTNDTDGILNDLNKSSNEKRNLEVVPELPERSPSGFMYTYNTHDRTYTRESSDQGVGCYCKKSKVEPLESIMMMNELFEDVWPDRDISTNEVSEYTSRIELAFKIDVAVYTKEVLTVSRLAYPNRLEALYKFISNIDTNLCLANQQYLGPLSETALHVALLFNNSICAKFLIENGTKALLMHEYGCSEYRGTTALHLAVVNGNIDIIDSMMKRLEPNERLELLHKRATGDFFREKFAASELPLSLSVWTGRLDIFRKLRSYGAEVDECEEFTGNNIIHSIVNFSKYDPVLACNMCTEVLECELHPSWWQREDKTKTDTVNKHSKSAKSHTIEIKQKLLGQKNKAGLTPLALAAKSVSPGIFDTIINTEDVYRFSQWKYGPASYNYYDVTEIDPSVCSPGSQSVLELLVYSPGITTGIEILSMKPIEQLLELKWKQMRIHFLCFSLLHAITMCLLFCYTAFRPLSNANVTTTDALNVAQTYLVRVKEPIVETFDTPSEALLWVSQIWVFLVAMVYLALDLVDLMRTPWFVIRPMVLMIVLELMFSLSAIIWFAFKLANVKEEDLALSIASLSGWTVMLFFSRGMQMFGFFSVMFQKMFFDDLPRFAITFGFVMISFTAAFFVIFQETRVDTLPPELKTIPITFLTLFRLLTGLADFEFIAESHYPPYCTILYLLFILVVNIVLVNMLIALFSDTYTRIAENSNVLWRKLRGAIVLMMERRIRWAYKCHSGLVKAFVNENDKIKLKWFLPVEDINFEKFLKNRDGKSVGAPAQNKNQ